MRIKLLTTLATPRSAARAGEVVDLPKADAIRMIERGLAEPVRDIETETAVPNEGERAITRQRGNRVPSHQSIEKD